MQKVIKTIRHTILALAAAVGLGVAALPITTFADDDADPEDHPQDSSVVSVNVASILTLSDVTSPTFSVDQNSLNTSNTIPATVVTNSSTGYSLSVAANSATDVDLVNQTNNTYTIPATTSTTLTAGTAAWGVKGGSLSGFTAVSTTGVTYYSQSTYSKGTTTSLTVGVATATAQPSGTYKSNLVITALAN